MRKSDDQNTLSEQGGIPESSKVSGSAEVTQWTRSNDMNRVGTHLVSTLLVEPNTLLREGLKRILSETSYSLAASAASLDEARRDWVPGSEPFLLIIDAVNDHEAKCSQVAQLKAELPSARVLMLVDQYDLKRVLAAYQAGADAYLIKSVSCEVLVKSLDLVMLGEAVFPSAVLNLLQEQANGDEETSYEQPDDDPESPPRGLSVRETVILRCLMEGDSNKLIARKFDITEATVKVHVKAILRKIRAKNRTQAAIWAASHLPSNGRGLGR
jgi:two-component system, NarL family, nitrate/nitrite response regulator NarL